MSDRDLWLLGLGGAVLLLGGGTVAIALSGNKITRSTLGGDGQIVQSPQELLAQASAAMKRPVTMAAYALARMAASEGTREARPRMHVALNDAADHDWDELTTVTYTRTPGQTRRFGKQHDSSSGITRRYATSRDPSRELVELAERVIIDHAQGNDPTYGAVKFVDASAFGVQEGTGSFEDLVDRWGREGLRPSNVPGYGSDFYVFRRA